MLHAATRWRCKLAYGGILAPPSQWGREPRTRSSLAGDAAQVQTRPTVTAIWQVQFRMNDTIPPDSPVPAEPSDELQVRPRGAVHRQRALALALALALVALAVLIAQPWQDDGDSPFGLVAQVVPPDPAVAAFSTAPEVGKLAPNFLLATIDGRTVRLSDLRGRPVFLNFWATWCFFCLSEMPAMQRFADRHSEEVVVVGVNVGEPATDARTFAANFGIRYPLLLDADRDVTEAYRVRAMPTSLFIDADGVVRSVSPSVLTPPQMEERLAEVLPGG